MTKYDNFIRSHTILYSLIFASGAATLSWEVIWQIKSSLALGVSARGAALTLAVIMGGMGLGSALVGTLLSKNTILYSIRVYGILEIVIGIAGLFLGASFQTIEKFDTYMYSQTPELAPLIHILAIVCSLGIPTLCMGATIPTFVCMAQNFKTSLASLYGINTLGAAGGALLSACILIPMFGVTHTSYIVSAVNVLVGISTIVLFSKNNTNLQLHPALSSTTQTTVLNYIFSILSNLPSKSTNLKSTHPAIIPHPLSPSSEILVVCVTGFATLSLEVAWFRSIASAFQSTTFAFAIMLASVLIALSFAARNVDYLRKNNFSLASVVCIAGVLIILATPVIERFDLFMSWNNHVSDPSSLAKQLVTSSAHPVSILLPILTLLSLFIMTYIVIALPIFFLGLGFPWILESQTSPINISLFYALNTLTSIVGSLSAAWLFLPTIGLAKTSWLSGSIVLLTGIFISTKLNKRLAWCFVGLITLLIVSLLDSGVGRIRAQGSEFYLGHDSTKLLEFYEGPDSTVSVSENTTGTRILVIDGASAAGQSGKIKLPGAHYFSWMGRLPMLLHPNPKNALVICFGTGQTANAVRRENPETLDIVDINPRIFKLAHNFNANEEVLEDPRVHAIVMDGRAYMRRTQKNYDVITLEPMPPNMAGVNALYSKEFYVLARQRLSSQGVIAQWLPFRSVTPLYAASIARTFKEVFPNSFLWIDPISLDGILLGSKDDHDSLGTSWPGFNRSIVARDLSENEVKKAVALHQTDLAIYDKYGEIISDDNQLLAYGKNILSVYANEDLIKENFSLLKDIKSVSPQ